MQTILRTHLQFESVHECDKVLAKANARFQSFRFLVILAGIATNLCGLGDPFGGFDTLLGGMLDSRGYTNLQTRNSSSAVELSIA